MGMYDQEPNFEDNFDVGDRLVLMGLTYVGKINTRFGEAEKVLVDAVIRDGGAPKGGRRAKYSAIGAGFASMARRAERADFPHVAEYVRIGLPSGNEVKRFERVDIDPRAWLQGDDGPPLAVRDVLDGTGDTPGAGTNADDDIPF